MGSLIVYSGIAAKVKAMERWRIKRSSFRKWQPLRPWGRLWSIFGVFCLTKKSLGIWQNEELHRGTIEQLLDLSQYRDFAKLYQFANMKQRHFLDLYFMHYEIGILKTCLRNAAGHREQRRDLSMFRDFFERHSDLDLMALSRSSSTEEFIGNLKGSMYYEPLNHILQEGQVNLLACENALDMMYFRFIWKIKG